MTLEMDQAFRDVGVVVTVPIVSTGKC